MEIEPFNQKLDKTVTRNTKLKISLEFLLDSKQVAIAVTHILRHQ